MTVSRFDSMPKSRKDKLSKGDRAAYNAAVSLLANARVLRVGDRTPDTLRDRKKSFAMASEASERTLLAAEAAKLPSSSQLRVLRSSKFGFE